MTTWQWKVILALIRLVLNSHGMRINTGEEYTEDINLLQETLRRDNDV